MNDPRDPSLWGHIFNERGALLAIFGALGGAVRAAATKTTWREGVRVVFVGSATAFGVGALGPWVLQPWLGNLPEDVAGALGTLCAAAFIVGLMAVTLIERLIDGRKLRND
jgi:drug/metabolite transporter (DMT)-like permease